MLDRSSCNLRRMRLSRINLTDDELVVLLQGLHSLVELIIHEDASPMITERVLKRMTHEVSIGLPLLVPKLGRLDINASFDLDDQIILDLVRSRWRIEISNNVDTSLLQVECLESVSLGIARDIGLETIAQMALWRKEGLKLDVEARGKRVVWT